jgi:hypothetical protein
MFVDMDRPEVPDLSVEDRTAAINGLTEALLTELIDFANRNVRFKDGQLDKTGFEIPEGAPVPDCGVVEEEVVAIYSFLARRNRIPEGEDYFYFELSKTLRRENIVLPLHVAKDAFGIDDEPFTRPGDNSEADPNSLQGMVDAQDGPIENEYTHDHELKFTINSKVGVPAVCENYAYYDSDGDKVHALCTCPDAMEALLKDDDFDMMASGEPRHDIEEFDPFEVLLADANIDVLQEALGDDKLRDRHITLVWMHQTLADVKRALKDLVG